MRLQLKPNHASKLAFQRIDILIPNLGSEIVDFKNCTYHLCDTERGLTIIAGEDLMRDLENYKRLIDIKTDLSHVIRGGTL